MNHLKAFEAQSNEYYREVSHDDYLALKWDPTGRYRTKIIDRREMADIDKALGQTPASLKKTNQGVMVNPVTFDTDYFTIIELGSLKLGRYRKYTMTISKCAFMDDEPFWAVHLVQSPEVLIPFSVPETTHRYFICDGIEGLRKMIAQELPGTQTT